MSWKCETRHWRMKAFLSPEPFLLGHLLKIRLWVRRLKGEIWLAFQRTAISQKLIEQFSPGKIILSKYVNTNTSFLRNTSLLKLLRVLKRPIIQEHALYGNYCMFSCTSGSVYPTAYEDRARPRGPGNEDGYWLASLSFFHHIANQFMKT